jgi:Swt1-like HEPN
MNWKSSQHIDENKYELPGDWLKIEYFEALNILFRFENALRVFVYIILKNEFQEKWCDLSITSDDEEKSTINAITKKRIAQDKNYAYLGYVLNSQLLHLTSGELIRIITSDSYWKYFKEYFLGTKEIIKNKLDEIGNVRNSVAHFRPIKKNDIELIKQNSNHTLTEIEKTIKDLVMCPDIVPTNSDESWYKELVVLGSNECKINFKQSKKEEWIKLIVIFNNPILKNEKSYSGYRVKALNIKVTPLLNIYKNLAKHTICVTESMPTLFLKNPEYLSLTKEVRFTFSKVTLTKNYSVIKEEIEKLLIQISNEVELIEKDNLARGKMIEVINCYLTKLKEGEYFSLDTSQFITEIDENSPVEFWGTLNHVSDNFVTDTEKYPWMPVDISDDKGGLPF